MKNKTDRITISGKNYKIDVEQAKKLKILTEDNDIVSFNTGDLFRSENGATTLIVVESGCCSNMYNIMGFNGFNHYSDFPSKGISKKEMLDFLNGGDDGTRYIFVTNLNGRLNEIIEEACDEIP